MHEGEKENLPIEAKIFSTANAMAHFVSPDNKTSDFYLVMCWNHYLFENKGLNDYKAWVLKKIERDYTTKIYFDPERNKIKTHYKALKKVFGTLE